MRGKLNSVMMCAILILTFLYGHNGNFQFSEYGFLYKNVQLSGFIHYQFVSIVFRTTKHNGLLFYALSAGDTFISVELYRGSIRVSGNFSNSYLENPFVGWAGFGLSDGKIHQVEFYKSVSDLVLIVDRPYNNTAQSSIIVSYQLRSSRWIKEIYVAGHPQLWKFDNFITLTKTSFVGCVEVATWESINLLEDAYFENAIPVCELDIEPPVITFTKNSSNIKVVRENNKKGITLEFSLILYQNNTNIIYHEYDKTVFNLSVTTGRLRITVELDGIVVIDGVNPKQQVNNGEWHKVFIYLPGKNDSDQTVRFYVDDEQIISPSPVHYETNRMIQIGGFGFTGCIKDLVVDNSTFRITKNIEKGGISLKGCKITTPCNPNPCNNGGTCILTENNQFSCQCLQNSTGFLCNLPIAFQTCSQMHKNGFRENGPTLIDVDGIGPYDPFYVECIGMDTEDSNKAITQFSPYVYEYTMINSPGTWEIKYNVSVQMLSILAELSEQCSQAVTYQCTKSMITNGNITMLNWVGGDGMIHDYWNSIGVYGKCQCAIEVNTCENNKNCNCDMRDEVGRVDLVEFRIKEHLPVQYINAMDIASSNGSSALVRVGALRCNGFGGKLNSVTFQEVFNFLITPPLDTTSAGTLEFEFKTVQALGNIMLFCQGKISTDYILVWLKNSTAVGVKFNMGEMDYEISVDISVLKIKLDDNKYHKFRFEFNRLIAIVTVEGISIEVNIKSSNYYSVMLNLDNMPTYIGGTPYDRFAGFKGTIRAFFVNGRPINVKDIAIESSLSGVYPGPASTCLTPKVCNTGICKEFYNYYQCDCATSPFYGAACHEERGISTEAYNYAILYRFNKVYIAESLHFVIGFSTTTESSLFGLQAKKPNVYVVVSIKNGNLLIEYNFQTNVDDELTKLEISSAKIGFTLTDGKIHIIKVFIEPLLMIITIDDNIFTEKVESVGLTNMVMSEPSVLFVGGVVLQQYVSEYETQLRFPPFKGCISGMKLLIEATGYEFNVLIDPVGLFYQRSNDIEVGNIIEKKCGAIYIVYPPAPLILYPMNPIPADMSKTEKRLPLGQSWGPTVLGLCVFLFTLLLLMLALIARWVSRNKGCYKTNEETCFKNDINKVKIRKRSEEENAEAKPLMAAFDDNNNNNYYT